MPNMNWKAKLFVLAVMFQMAPSDEGFTSGAPCSSRNTLHILSKNRKYISMATQCIDMSYSSIDRVKPYYHFMTKSINTIYADNMNLTTIPASFTNRLLHLELADFSMNNIRRFNRLVLYKNEYLRTLLLSFNKIFIPSKRSLLVSSSLANLHLENNQIKRILACTFRDLPRLKSLLLNNNLIKQIPAEALAPLMHLKYLNVEGNFIKTMPPLQDLPATLVLLRSDFQNVTRKIIR